MEEYTERLGYAPLGRLLLRLSLPSIAAADAYSRKQNLVGKDDGQRGDSPVAQLGHPEGIDDVIKA